MPTSDPRSPDPTRTVVLTVNPTAADAWKGRVAAPVAVINAATPAERWQLRPDVTPYDAHWRAAGAAVTEAVEALRAVPFDSYDRVALFAMAPFGVGALVACAVSQLVEPRGKSLAIHHWDRDAGWVNWGPAGIALDRAALGEAPAVTLPARPDYAVAHVAIQVSLTRQIDQKAVDVALANHAVGPARAVHLDLTPLISRHAIEGPSHADRVARALSRSLDAIKDAFPSARRHLFYVGPLALLMRAAQGFHVPNDLWVYDWLHGARYLPTATFPKGTLWLPDGRPPEIALVAEPHLTDALAPLVTAIESHGARAFFAPVSLRPGDRWDVMREAAVESAGVVGIAVDARTDGAWYENEDVVIAIDRAQAGAARVVPLRLHPSARVKYGLRRVVPLDWPDAEPSRLEDIARELVAQLRLQDAGLGARGAGGMPSSDMPSVGMPSVDMPSDGATASDTEPS